MKRSELLELAKVGLHVSLKRMQADLMDRYREFPDLFSVPPMFLKPGLKDSSSSNGTGPVVITTVPRQQAGSKSAKILPLLASAGPLRPTEIARRLRLKSAGSLSTTLAKHSNAGTIERVEHGVYGITAAGKAAISSRSSGKRTRQRTFGSKIRQQRALSAAILAALEDGPKTSKALENAGHDIHSLGSLVRRGYMSRTKDGMYKRTAKPYMVDNRQSAE